MKEYKPLPDILTHIGELEPIKIYPVTEFELKLLQDSISDLSKLPDSSSNSSAVAFILGSILSTGLALFSIKLETMSSSTTILLISMIISVSMSGLLLIMLFNKRDKANEKARLELLERIAIIEKRIHHRNKETQKEIEDNEEIEERTVRAIIERLKTIS